MLKHRRGKNADSLGSVRAVQVSEFTLMGHDSIGVFPVKKAQLPPGQPVGFGFLGSLPGIAVPDDQLRFRRFKFTGRGLRIRLGFNNLLP